jgi:hypothetical protein
MKSHGANLQFATDISKVRRYLHNLSDADIEWRGWIGSSWMGFNSLLRFQSGRIAEMRWSFPTPPETRKRLAIVASIGYSNLQFLYTSAPLGGTFLPNLNGEASTDYIHCHAFKPTLLRKYVCEVTLIVEDADLDLIIIPLPMMAYFTSLY